MFKLPSNVTFESLKMELMQIPQTDLLRMAVALALVAIAAYFYYNKKPKGVSMHLLISIWAYTLFNYYAWWISLYMHISTGASLKWMSLELFERIFNCVFGNALSSVCNCLKWMVRHWLNIIIIIIIIINESLECYWFIVTTNNYARFKWWSGHI